MKTLYVIHHSHTDIGYTHLQHKITTRHIDFIKQAVKIIERRIKAGKQEKTPFVWTCETFWAVERFWENADAIAREKFIEFVRKGYISISGNYLNFNELITTELLEKLLARKSIFETENNIEIHSGMTADINGFGWGYSDLLYRSGITNFFTCVHTHHGMFPLFRKQTPFFWETPSGNKLLVWNGEHYHLGNELGLAPLANSSYTIKDECDAETIFSDNWQVAELRIPRYLESLEKSGYPFDFAPVMVSGLRTDNSPPSEKVADMIEKWNKKHGDKIYLKMATLDEFFAQVREHVKQIPTYKGDWPDWWSDGFASAPNATSIFKKGSRVYQKTLLLKQESEELFNEDKIVDFGALYAEHTFSHSESVRSPWNYLASEISARKKAYAMQFLEQAEIAHDGLLTALGMTEFSAEMSLKYKVINPFASEINSIVGLEIGHFEYNERKLDKGFYVTDGTQKLPAQIQPTANGADILVPLHLAANQTKTLEIIAENNQTYNMISPTKLVASDQVDDLIRQETYSEMKQLDSDLYCITFDSAGITSIYDKRFKQELFAEENEHSPFMPVYDISYSKNRNSPADIRSQMGRNRKSENFQQFVGKVISISEPKKGEVFSEIELDIACEGFRLFKLNLKNYHHFPCLDIKIIAHKKSLWEAENVYISLPFATEQDRIVLDKIGCEIEPQVDQLPGTCIDFYTVQNGMSVEKDNCKIHLGLLDAPIIQLGDIKYRQRLLHEADNPHNFKQYNWIMTNYWETNFEAELGGFYEFNYKITTTELNGDSNKDILKRLNLGVECFRV
jgi:hypothetical protein